MSIIMATTINMRPIQKKGSNSTPKMNKQIGPAWDCFSFIFIRSATGVEMAMGGGSFWVSALDGGL